MPVFSDPESPLEDKGKTKFLEFNVRDSVNRKLAFRYLVLND